MNVVMIRVWGVVRCSNGEKKAVDSIEGDIEFPETLGSKRSAEEEGDASGLVRRGEGVGRKFPVGAKVEKFTRSGGLSAGMKAAGH